ncbi:MAG: hypothetical protein V3U71_00625 [Cocleimonas sp.]
MNNKSTALLATTLLTILSVSQPVLAGQAPTDEYSAPNVYTVADSQERVNFSMQVTPIDEKISAEIFTDNEH